MCVCACVCVFFYVLLKYVLLVPLKLEKANNCEWPWKP